MLTSVSGVQVEVLEKGPKPGGLVKCDYVSDNLFHRVGGHVFNARNESVSRWFWSHFDQKTEFLKAKRNAKILMAGKLIGYPLENYLFELDKNLVKAVVDDLLRIQKTIPKAPFEYDNFEEFLKGNFGETLYHLYFRPYNQKIWNTDLSQVALEWLEGKLPMPNIREIFLSNIIKEEESGMVHSTFFYPKAGGSQFIADRFSEGLNIVTGFEVQRIVKHNKGFRINDDLTAETVIYTGDVRKLAGIIDTSDRQLRAALDQVKYLKANGTSNLFCECDDNDLSWLYIPEDFTRAHRIIYTGNFSPLNNRGSKRRTCVVEFSGQVAPAVMEAEIRKLPGNLSPLSFNYEPNSYVVQEKDTRLKIKHLKELLKQDNFYLLGRFAEWEYYNMDKAIEASQQLAAEVMV
jgi:protoporphyrinogen oxidase